MNGNAPRIGYAPISASLEQPGDRRRFAAYARARNLPFELARPEERYDLVVLTQLADIGVWSDYPHGKVVYDLVDSYLAIPRSDVRQWLRGPVWFAMGRYRRLRIDHWAAIQDMCRRADAVVCVTEEQRRDIQRYCPNVHIVLDVHTSVVRNVKEDYRCGDPFNLVWEGQAINISQFRQIHEVLRAISQRRPLVLNLVTDPDRPRLLGRFGRVQSLDQAREVFDSVRLHTWDEATWSEVIRGCDLAVIPIDLSDPFATGKPENKLLLLWRMGMPVLTSATPAYQRAMRDAGMEGLACRDQEEWMTAIERMIGDESLRRDVGVRGRVFAETHHGQEALLARWDAVFASLGFSLHEGVPT
jgi:glycosyltransferase involved in cell wall biosynthesis